MEEIKNVAGPGVLIGFGTKYMAFFSRMTWNPLMIEYFKIMVDVDVVGVWSGLMLKVIPSYSWTVREMMLSIVIVSSKNVIPVDF